LQDHALLQRARLVDRQSESCRGAVDREAPVPVALGRGLERARHAVGGRAHDAPRSSCRRILPVGGLGSWLTRATRREYLCGALFAFTKSCSSRASSSLARAPGASTTNARGLVSPCSSSWPTTAASSTAGWAASSPSTSNGET